MDIVVPPGLDGVIVAETAISEIDAAGGHLRYRGRDVEEVVERFRFEELVEWLAEPERLLELGRDPDSGPMGVLMETLVAEGEGLDVGEPGAVPRYLVRVAERFAERLGPGWTGPLPDGVGLAGRYLAHLRGTAPSLEEARALDAYWVMAAEHSLNASTFAVRIAASTGARLPLALAAGVAVLSGPLHGGAPTGVLDLLDEAALYRQDLPGLVAAKLEAGERIMGFGHRVYRAEDPRARALRARFRVLARSHERVALASELEAAVLTALSARHPERVLATNVEFYAAVVLDALGIPRAWCPPTFAVGRMAGWTAHYVEQRAEGRLIRPLARYRPRPSAPSA